MMQAKEYSNPIFPGFYPDPSACRVGDDFYMVHSTFNYFPGIPVSHSRDLVHWEQVGNVIHRSGQLERKGIEHSRGIFAPTIRFHEGTFYVICTHVDGKDTFVCTATDPAGPWSDPHWLPNAPGIDPSLFFDDDGKCWYCGCRPAPEGPAYFGNWEAWIQEIDIKNFKLVGESLPIWRGALIGACWPEGPHIYKKDGYYYIMTAEGGTGLEHAICIARSKSLQGPWEGKKANPILTHRHLGWNTPIINVGHGELLDDTKGNWWMVLLASRPYGGRAYNLGRETFLVPVRWQDGWPWPSPETGMVEETFPFPDMTPAPVLPEPACDQFDEPELPLHWLTLLPDEEFAQASKVPGRLRIPLSAPSLRDSAMSGFAGRRQKHMNWTVATAMEFYPESEKQEAGLALVQSHDFQYRLELILRDKVPTIRLIQAEGAEDKEVATAPCPWLKKESPMMVLSASAFGQELQFSFGPSQYQLTELASGLDGTILSTERAGGFVGNVLGVYGSDNGSKSGGHADFLWFQYQGK